MRAIIALLLLLSSTAEASALERAQIRFKMRLDTPCDTHACGVVQRVESELKEKLKALCDALAGSYQPQILKFEVNGIMTANGSGDGYGYLDAVDEDVAANCVRKADTGF